MSTVHPTDRQRTKDKLPRIEKITVKQTIDAYYCKAETQVGLSGSDFYVDPNGRLVRTSKSDGCQKKVVPISLREGIPHVEYYPQIYERPGERRMQDKIWKDFLYPHMASNIHQTVSNCVYARVASIRRGASDICIYSWQPNLLH